MTHGILTLHLVLLFATVVNQVHDNNALNVNTIYQNNKHVQIAITAWSSDFYYAIMSAMGATALGIFAMSLKKPRTDRIFFYICTVICMVATIAYFCMGSNLGWTPIEVKWERNIPGVLGRNKQVFYACYVDW